MAHLSNEQMSIEMSIQRQVQYSYNYCMSLPLGWQIRGEQM